MAKSQKQTSLDSFFCSNVPSGSKERNLQPNTSASMSTDKTASTSGRVSPAADDSRITDKRDPVFGTNATDIEAGPFQPRDCNFKNTTFGKRTRCFKPQWYGSYCWLEYSIKLDAAFCFYCRVYSSNLPGCADETFIKTGMRNWKKALEKFKKHENSEIHRRSTQFYVEKRPTGSSVVCQLDSFHKETIEKNKKYLKFILETLLFLGKQGISFRGHDESSDSLNRGNLLELLNLRCADKNLDFKDFLQSKVCNYTSKDSQNEIIDLIGEFIVQDIVVEVNSASCYSLIVDETTDISRMEQVAIGIRYCSIRENEFIIRERFMGFINTTDTSGESLFQIIKDYLHKIGVPVKSLRFQSYDGASNMSGKFNGLAAKFKEIEPKALYFHCHAHLLELAVARTCAETKSLRDALGIVNNLYNIIEASAKRHGIFQKIISEVCPGSNIKTLKSLSQTRWTMRHVSVKTVVRLLPAIVTTLKIISNDTNNPRVSADASGLLKMILDEEFLLSLIIIELMLGTTTILSKELQCPQISISLIFPKVNATILTLENYRTEEYFNKCFQKMKTLSKEIQEESHEVKEVALPRRRKIPKRLDETSQNIFYFSDVKDFLRVNLFFTCLDELTGNLKLRFSKNDYTIISKIENCLLVHKHNFYEGDDEILNNFYKFTDDVTELHRQINVYINCMTSSISIDNTIEDYAALFLKYELKSMLPLVWQLFELVLTCPVKTASAERYFSSLKRIKTYLRSTMGQQRLSGLALMNIEKENTTKLMTQNGLRTLADKFATKKNRRMLFY